MQSHSKESSEQLSLNQSYLNEGGLDLGQFFEIIKRRNILIASITSLFTIGTLLWSITRPPSYVSQFEMLVEPETAESDVVRSLSTNREQDVTSNDLGATQNAKSSLDYATQIEVLMSRDLLEKAIQKLDNSLPELTVDRIRQNLKIERKGGASKILVVNYRSDSLEETQFILRELSGIYLNYSLNERQTNVQRALDFTDKQLPTVKAQVNSIESEIQKFQERNNILDPNNSITQIAEQLNQVEANLLNTQVELSKKRQLYNSLQNQLQLQPDSAEAASVLSEAPEYQKLVQQLQAIETEIKLSESDLSNLHPKVISLREQRDRLIPLVKQASQNVLGDRLTESVTDPSKIPFQTGLRQGLSQQLIDAAIQINVLETQQKELAETRRYLEAKSIQLPKLKRQYEVLQRQLEIASSNLKKFLEQREELFINAAREEVPWRLIEPPQEATSVVFTSLPRDISLGAFLGLLMGIGLAILLDKNSGVIRTVQELREVTNLPIIGSIPIENNIEAITLRSISIPSTILTSETLGHSSSANYSASPFIESFRSLYIQLRLLQAKDDDLSLVVSSVKPAEGKSTIAFHLAEAASKMGKRVLLIDADLKRPVLQKRLRKPDGLGLVDYLAMENLTLEDIIYDIPGNENLSLIASGTHIDESSNLLSSPSMQNLMRQLHNHFDLVIYDSPPLGFADSAILGSQTDGLILVGKMGDLNRRTFRETLHNLEVAKIKVFGLVANGVREQNLPYYREYAERYSVA